MSTKQSKSVKKAVAPKKAATATAAVAAAPTKKAAAPKKAVAEVAAAAAPVAAPAVAAPKKVATKKAVAPKKTASKKVAATKKGGAAKPKAAKATKAAKAPKAAVAVDGDDVEGEAGSKTRFFKVVVGDTELPHGRFSGSKPKQAANKALTSIFKSKEQSGGGVTGKVKFSIVECTRNSKHKKYHYVGERVKLKEPMKVTIGKGPDAKVIEYKFNNRVMKDKTVTA